MANTIDVKLIADLVLSSSSVIGKSVLAPFASFSTSFSDDLNRISNGKPSTAQVGITTSTGSTKKNPSTYNNSDLTVVASTVALDLYSKQIGIEWSSAHDLEKSVQKAIYDLSKDLVAVTLGKVTTTNGFADEEFDITGATTSELKDALFEGIYGLTDTSSKYLICGSALYGKALPSNTVSFDPKANPSMRGFDGVYQSAGLATDVKGVLTDGNGIIVASQIPNFGLKALESEVVTLENGLSILVNYFEDAVSTRSRYYSLDVVFGAGIGSVGNTKILIQKVEEGA